VRTFLNAVVIVTAVFIVPTIALAFLPGSLGPGILPKAT
jgi:hypothetical protein